MSQIHLSWCWRVVHIPSHFQRRYFCPKNKNFQKHEELVISPWNQAVVLSALVFQVLLVVDTASVVMATTVSSLLVVSLLT